MFLFRSFNWNEKQQQQQYQEQTIQEIQENLSWEERCHVQVKNKGECMK